MPQITSNDKLKEIDIKNHTCYYFHDTIKIEDFDLDNILIHEISYQNILIYNISYKSLIDSKLLHIRFNKIDRLIRDETRYLALFGSEKYGLIYYRISYLTLFIIIIQKSKLIHSILCS